MSFGFLNRKKAPEFSVGSVEDFTDGHQIFTVEHEDRKVRTGILAPRDSQDIRIYADEGSVGDPQRSALTLEIKEGRQLSVERQVDIAIDLAKIVLSIPRIEEK